MGKNKGSKRGTQDPDAPPPVLRDQGGLAAVARAMAAQAAAAAAIAVSSTPYTPDTLHPNP
jgi:hypothetical protein